MCIGSGVFTTRRTVAPEPGRWWGIFPGADARHLSPATLKDPVPPSAASGNRSERRVIARPESDDQLVYQRRLAGSGRANDKYSCITVVLRRLGIHCRATSSRGVGGNSSQKAATISLANICSACSHIAGLHRWLSKSKIWPHRTHLLCRLLICSPHTTAEHDGQVCLCRDERAAENDGIKRHPFGRARQSGTVTEYLIVRLPVTG
jgi:hypothetical protein